MNMQELSKVFESKGVAHSLVLADNKMNTPFDYTTLFDEAFEAFVEKCRKIVKDRLPSYDIRVDKGGRYNKLVRIDKRSEFGSVFCFVDKTNGDVLKAASFKAPAKGARGNIFDEANGVKRARWTGVA